MTTASREAFLIFTGADGFDVFNCSAPFVHSSNVYMYGNVEKRCDSRNAHTSLFRQTAPDTFALESDVLSHQIEKPHAVVMDDEVILGGTLVVKDKNDVLNCYTDIYRGVPQKVFYFTSGPDRCLHIRIAPLPSSGAVAVFATLQSEPCTVRLATVSSVNEINDQVIAGAAALKDPHQFFARAQSVVITQALTLPSNHFGCVGLKVEDGKCTVVACVVDASTHSLTRCTPLAGRDSFPACTAKTPQTAGRLFPAGVTVDSAGQWHLYCGVDDAHQCRVPVAYPFEPFGAALNPPALPVCQHS